MENGKPDVPVVHPEITIDGTLYTLNPDTYLTAYVLDELKVRSDQIAAILVSENPGRVVLAFKLLSALTAHQFVRQGLPYRTPEQWAMMLPKESLVEVYGAIAKAIFPNVKPLQPEAQPVAAVN